MRDGRSSAPAALALWLGVSALASAIAGGHPLAALAVASAGGAWFGWLSARRADPIRVRVGRRRRSGRAIEE